MGRLARPGAGVGSLRIVALLEASAQRWMSPAVQSSAFAAYWRTTIQRPVCPLANAPVILSGCQEVVRGDLRGTGQVGRVGVVDDRERDLAGARGDADPDVEGVGTTVGEASERPAAR